MADIVNGRCHNARAPQNGPPLFQNGKIIIQAHDIGWLVSGVFTIAATAISLWLMNKHLRWYTNPGEQRYILRILLMVPIYAWVSLASYLFWNHSTPLLLLRDCYESTVLTSFFYLLLTYLSPDPAEQKELFRKLGLSRENDREMLRLGEPLKKWAFPLSFVKWKPADGFYFLQLMKWGVLQYCVVRPTTTLAAVILDYAGLYCEDSWSPGWGHLYISVIVSISVSIAMYCLIQLYIPVSKILQPQKPLLKLFAVKAVVFLTFWQASALSMLATFGLVKDTKYMTADNINIGIGAIMETVEMTLFALLHLKAFSYKPYVISPGPTKRLRALAHAFNFKETLQELWAGMIYMYRRMRGEEVDMMARRQAVLEGVFGHTRVQVHGLDTAAPSKQASAKDEKDMLAVRMDVEETVHIGAERQWLGVGDDYAYGLGYHSRPSREKSDGLQEQIERELTDRGYARRQPSKDRRQYDPIPPVDQEQARRNRRSEGSWWRRTYNRLSQSEPLEEILPHMDNLPHVVEKLPPVEPRKAFKPRRPEITIHMDPRQNLYEDPPPPSVIRSFRESRSRIQSTEFGQLSSAFGRDNERSTPSSFDHSHHSVPSDRRRSSVPPLRLEIPAPHQVPDPTTSYVPHGTTNAGFSRSDNDSFPSVERRELQPRLSTAAKPYSTVRPSIVSPTPRYPESTVIPSHASSPPMTNRSDSFLGRAFKNHLDSSPSTEALTLGTQSSQSHESRVRLSGRPMVLPGGEVASATPRVVHYPSEREYRALRQLSGQALTNMPAPRSTRADRRFSAPQLPPDVHTQRYYRQAPESAPQPQAHPVVKSRLRRDQIVLPAPLAPITTRSGSASNPQPSPPASVPTTSSQLKRSRHGNQRRYSSGDPYQPTRDPTSRRLSFPLAYPTIEEDFSGPSYTSEYPWNPQGGRS